MTEHKSDRLGPNRLDEELGALPRDIEPSRDLWPSISTSIRSHSSESRSRRFAIPWTQLAAAVVLTIATAATTYLLTKQSLTVQAQWTSGLEGDAEYASARLELERLFEQRIVDLPPATQARLRQNLSELRHAADEIVATLAEHPSNSLLQELLVSTRQRELQLLAEIGRMTLPNS